MTILVEKLQSLSLQSNSKIERKAAFFLATNETDFENEPKTKKEFTEYVFLWIEEDKKTIAEPKRQAKEEMINYLTQMYGQNFTPLQKKVLCYIWEKESRASLLGIIAEKLMSRSWQEYVGFIPKLEQKCNTTHSSKVRRELETVKAKVINKIFFIEFPVYNYKKGND